MSELTESDLTAIETRAMQIPRLNILACAETVRDLFTLAAEVRRQKQEIERLRKVIIEMERSISQTLGAALGFPRFVDLRDDFPDATEADGVCTFTDTSETLALQAAKDIERLRALVPRWIPVRERYPENYVSVLTRNNQSYPIIGHSTGMGTWRDSQTCLYIPVTHWMPILDLPEKES